MHWVLQDDFYQEAGYRKMVETLQRFEIPHSLHKVVPFVGELQPDIDIFDKNAIVIGSYSMRHVAAAKGWTPGCYTMDHFQFDEQCVYWGENNLLNGDAYVCTFGNVLNHINTNEVFIRPYLDSKVFAGGIMQRDQIAQWHHSVVQLREDAGTTLSEDTEVIIASPKHILREIRMWVVDRHIVTQSMYKIGSRIIYHPHVTDNVLDFARSLIENHNPCRAFVLDIAVMDNFDLKVVEAQCINTSGFYAADVQKLVLSLNDV